MRELEAKVLRRLPTAAKAKLSAANERNAAEFLGRVAAIIPKGDSADGQLADTLHKGPAPGSETGVAVSIGSEAHPYPLHLEAGHRAEDGSHVPGKAYWNPSKAVMRKRARNRQARAIREAVRVVTG